DTDSSSTVLIPLQNAGAREIATSLTSLVGSGEGGRDTASIVPIDSSNSIALRGDRARKGCGFRISRCTPSASPARGPRRSPRR
ncbi:hypothetical protein FKL64_24310, partial [Escherichia coli]|nr:hypothetical protein [Escherichia coli]